MEQNLHENQNENSAVKAKPTLARRFGKHTDESGNSHHFWRRVLLILITLIIAVLFISRIIFLIFGEKMAEKPQSFLSGLLMPVQTAFSSVVDWVHDYFYDLKLRSRLELEYNNLRQENEQLMYQVMLLDELEHKLSVYESLYDEMSANESLNPITATVVGSDNHNYFSVFTINKGSLNGIKDFMAVTVNGALVGYTYNVEATTSTVRTIIDSSASIAALLSTSRDQGTVRGTLDIDGKPMCRMYYLPEDNLPRPGDQVVTSGVGMSFPKGIPIGTVRESTRGMESNKSYVVIEPLADFQHIEYVIVLRYQPEAGAIVDTQQSGTSLEVAPLDTPRPVPTIMIGTEFFQLAPTPEPTATPAPATVTDEFGNIIEVTPAPTEKIDDTVEYRLPSTTDAPVSTEKQPTPTPSPTPVPEQLDLTVEEE